MLSKKQWILAPVLMVASVVGVGTEQAKADVRVNPIWGGISISFGSQPRVCRPSYNSFFGSSVIRRHISPYVRPSLHQRYVPRRHSTYLRSRTRSNCNPRFRR